MGKRFFPTTLIVDDPFVADELILPSVVHTPRSSRIGAGGAAETQIGAEFSKRITSAFSVSLEGGLIALDRSDGPGVTGFENLGLVLKHELFRSEPHEAIAAAALGWEVGGTGRTAVGAGASDVVKPRLTAGKGFGDLPETLGAVKPLALTAAIGAKLSTSDSRNAEPTRLQWGVVAEYSLPYLESFVKDLELPAPLDDLVPVVELDLETVVGGRGQHGKTAGTVNPGIVWDGQTFQVALEAAVPINGRSGQGVGVRFGVAFFLDRLFPATVGRPIFPRR